MSKKLKNIINAIGGLIVLFGMLWMLGQAGGVEAGIADFNFGTLAINAALCLFGAVLVRV